MPSMESLAIDKTKWKELEEFYEQTGLKGYTSIMSKSLIPLLRNI
jgi:hypothetical protein